MKPSLVFLDAESVNPGDLSMDQFREITDYTEYPSTAANDIIHRAKEASILITNKCIIDRNIIQALPKLRLIQVAATGYNNIDIQAAFDANIIVTNVTNYSTSGVAQHVFAMLLQYFNNTSQYTTESRKGIWATKNWTYWHDPIHELEGKRLGIIGLGNIGKRVMQIGRAFGMEIMAPSRAPEKNTLKHVNYLEWGSFLQNSDIISLNCPLNASTQHLIDSSALAQMHSNAILINTSRGGVIDEKALENALRKRTIQAALLDVLDEEPPRKDHPFFGLDNCYITPHQAWGSQQSRQRLIEGMYQNIKHFIQGEPLQKIIPSQ